MKQAQKKTVFRVSQAGFTLSELLIALAILGIIAVFTIPKIMEANERQEAKAKIRETVAALESAWYSRKIKGEILYGQNLYANIQPQLNVVAGGPGSVPNTVLSLPHPCATPRPTPEPGVHQGWLVFPSGVVVTGINGVQLWFSLGPPVIELGPMDRLPWNHPGHNPGLNYVICIDYNGNKAPNQPGADVFFGNFNQWGAFMGPPPSENAKNFNWGSTANPGLDNVYRYGGGMCCTAPAVLLGVGDNTRTPPALVGALLEK